MSALSESAKRMDSIVASKMKINSRLSHDDIRFLAHVLVCFIGLIASQLIFQKFRMRIFSSEC